MSRRSTITQQKMVRHGVAGYVPMLCVVPVMISMNGQHEYQPLLVREGQEVKLVRFYFRSSNIEFDYIIVQNEFLIIVDFCNCCL